VATPRTKKTKTVEESKTFAMLAAQSALNKKALDVKIMDLKGLTSISDYFIVCTAESEVQVKAIADAVETGLQQNGWNPWHVEGKSNLKWVLLDYVDIVVHVFYKDAREYYGLDNLWGDAPYETIEDTPKGIKITKSKD